VIKKIFSILLLFNISVSFSQSINSCLHKAQNDVERGEYYEASAHYLEALNIDSLNKKANLEFGLLNCQYINNPEKAGVYLLRSERLSGNDTMPELLLGLAQYYQEVGKYQNALTYYKRLFSRFEKKPERDPIEAIILKSMSNCEYALSKPAQPVFKRMKSVNAGPGVNTIYPEYSPVVTKEGNVLMFTTRRESNVGHRIDDRDGNYFEDMYIARKDKNGIYTNAHAFGLEDKEVEGLNNTKRHEAVVSLSPGGDKFFTFKNNKIYESTWQNNSWTAPQLMSPVIDIAGGFESHLCISEDGKTIYFSSERPDGSGGLDIYKTELTNGDWGTPVNLGPTINTKDDDDSPFMSYDGKTLYFASKGHPGYGGFDLYRSTLSGTTWSVPENLGILFNSSGDDTHLSFNKDQSSAIFSSARPGSIGDMDIYELKYKEPFEDFVVDPLSRIQINLPDTFYLNEASTFGVSSNKLPPSAFKRYYWQVNDSVLGNAGEIVTYTFTNPGVTRVRVAGLTTENDIIGYEKNIVITNRKTTTVASNTTTVSTNTLTGSHTTNTVTVNTGGGSSLENIYFPFGKSIVNTEARQALLRNLKVLKDNPSLTLSIAAYCDSRGSAEYNKMLSQRRAANAAWYLQKHGLNKNRIKQIEGLGENDPATKCPDGTPCTAGEYKINRRVEFRVN
jgi:outer membrane protein OmpA-like peptidoglycan-associated protein/tetratricopeptide (TPR) repeat protein/YHS domain-containing protein